MCASMSSTVFRSRFHRSGYIIKSQQLKLTFVLLLLVSHDLGNSSFWHTFASPLPLYIWIAFQHHFKPNCTIKSSRVFCSTHHKPCQDALGKYFEYPPKSHRVWSHSLGSCTDQQNWGHGFRCYKDRSKWLIFNSFPWMEDDGDCRGIFLQVQEWTFPRIRMSLPTTSRNEHNISVSPKPPCIFISFGKDNKNHQKSVWITRFYRFLFSVFVECGQFGEDSHTREFI